MTGAKDVIVIGAGIVGVSTALWLQRDGHRVTLIDREGPAAGTSYGNGGILASGSIIPVTVPGLVWKAPGMLLRRDQPLFLKWSYLPRLVPFLRRYLRHANAASVDRAAEALHLLLHDAPDQHMALARGTAAERYLKPTDYLFGYKDRQAFQADRFGWQLRRRRQVPFEEMDAAALAAHDPALAGTFGFAVRCGGHGQITDPGAYVTALAEAFIAAGGRFVQTELRDIDLRDGVCAALQTSAGAMQADSYVLTTGAWSGAFARKLGVSVPLESERGYHIEFVNPSVTLKSTVMVASGKFVLNSMEGRLRCAGVVEFGGLTKPASVAPIAMLKRQVAGLFPDLTYDRVDEWMGHRPATADSIPVIGFSPKASNVLLGYGHHHIGLTGGPKTGRWLAQLVAGRPGNTDLAAYAPDRTT